VPRPPIIFSYLNWRVRGWRVKGKLIFRSFIPPIDFRQVALCSLPCVQVSQTLRPLLRFSPTPVWITETTVCDLLHGVTTSLTQIRPITRGWQDDLWMVNWKGFGKNRSWPNRRNMAQHFPGETKEEDSRSTETRTRHLPNTSVRCYRNVVQLLRPVKSQHVLSCESVM
jgi:hypothetical protein